MRFIDQTSGTAFDPMSSKWPENACVLERFVCLRIHRFEDHVVAEDPKLIWELPAFLEVARNGNELKRLLAKATNAITDVDAFGGGDKLRYATWQSEDSRCMFQLAYSEI